jgi:hypothetical protein
MTLTRSLYREDEAIAALKWCILNRRFNEALFWSQELMDSNMTHEFLSALMWVWMFTCGPSSSTWIKRFHDCIHSNNEDEYMNMMLSLMYHVKNVGDTSVLSLLGLGLCEHTKEPNVLVPIEIPGTLPKTPIISSLIQGKVDLAWTLLRPEWSNNAWESIQAVVAVKHPKQAEYLNIIMNAEKWMGSVWDVKYTWCLRAMATLLASSNSDLTLFVERDNFDHIMSMYNKHTDLTMRSRRICTIPRQCLYWFTKRGRLLVNQSNEEELQINLEDALTGSKYWSKFLPIGYDMEREEFYSRHFPDDIPDEWSKESRAVSHGYGSTPVGDKINHSNLLNGCLVKWFGNIPSKYVWRGFEIALEVFVNKWRYGKPPSIEIGIHRAYEEKSIESFITEMSSWSLNPKRRKFVVKSSTV